MDKGMENGSWKDPTVLPPHLKKLHRKIQAQARKDRAAQLPEPESHEERRWPGLVKPPSQ